MRQILTVVSALDSGRSMTTPPSQIFPRPRPHTHQEQGDMGGQRVHGLLRGPGGEKEGDIDLHFPYK